MQVVIIGSPLSGKSTYAKMVADTFGCVLVSPDQLVFEEGGRDPQVSRRYRGDIQKLNEIPDDVLLRLIDVRLRQPDCRMNGWVLDGFPSTETQLNLLKAMHVKPHVVVMLEQ